MKKQELLDEMKRISALIMKAKIENKSQLELRSQFAKLQREHKAIWLREYKKSLLTK